MQNEACNTNSPTPTKEDKHLSIDRAINDIDGVISHVQNILDKALGNPTAIGDPEKCDNAAPNLVDFLNGASDNIRRKMENLHDQLNQLESALF